MKQLETVWRLLADGAAILTALLLVLPAALTLWVLCGMLDWRQNARERRAAPSGGMPYPTVQGALRQERPLHDEGELQLMHTQRTQTGSEGGAPEHIFLAGLTDYARVQAVSFSPAESTALWHLYCRHQHEGEEREG